MLMRALFLIYTALSAVAPDAADQLEAKLVGAGGHYMWVDEEGRVSLWEETNGVPGLQVLPSSAGDGAPSFDADTRILA